MEVEGLREQTIIMMAIKETMDKAIIIHRTIKGIINKGINRIMLIIVEIEPMNRRMRDTIISPIIIIILMAMMRIAEEVITIIIRKKNMFL